MFYNMSCLRCAPSLSVPRPIWKCLLFIMFYNMCGLRCAPDSSHSDISHGPPLLGLGDAAVARVWGTSAHRHTRNSSHSNISMRPPTLPWPATCLLHLHFCALFAPLPRRNGRSPLDPPRHCVARMACEITLNRRCIAPPPTPPLARHLDLRILQHSLFLEFSSYPCAKHA